MSENPSQEKMQNFVGEGKEKVVEKKVGNVDLEFENSSFDPENIIRSELRIDSLKGIKNFGKKQEYPPDYSLSSSSKSNFIEQELS